ncbi:alpha/beta fold hydrolase [Cryptosporangium aurantiacum]|uniref:Pimeloyl-ACP methyl ester carboxylesterase n=1 Tax=Cryptosporangium aurantiacum TaxID=134849 RepID=A0A1M7QAA2_9ACTN|nr:alpha/beta hydrolase [Cryptosporangium aurantiacum]SHN27619.1 Pimeloyl-ACP methyl ester carboxylesterase [Cryptosporangium aurantiacum]
MFTTRYAPADRPVTVVLLPALFVGDWLWDRTWERLNADGWPVVRFGESVVSLDRKTARSVERVATQVLAACREHVSGPMVFCGDSLGALIAFQMARAHPDAVAGIVASGAPGLDKQANQVFGRQLLRRVRHPDEAADIFVKLLLHEPEQYEIDQQRYRETIDEVFRPHGMETLLSALAAVRGYPTKKVLPTLTCPKLFAWGRNDAITPVEPWERAVPTLSDARLVVYDRCGHAPMYERADEYHADLTAFLDYCVARPYVA